MTEFTAEDVATWMYEEVGRHGFLSQASAVADIGDRFGSRFVYMNQNGNLAVDAAVLAAFNERSGNEVVWEKRFGQWCQREAHHEPGRLQP